MRARRVLLGVTGGIAAFKAPRIVRLLRDAGCEVRCAVTRAAESFVAPLTLEVLSGSALYREEYLAPGVGGEELHVSAAAWADALLVAPATAHTLARLALGLADDFLTTTALNHDGPLILAPAMHSTMWAQPAVRDNVRRLEARGAVVVGPVLGPLASGEVGLGRMAEPRDIVRAVLGRGGELAGRRVLVTAGPTREAIDPVRYLSNRSSGKMGFALAAAAAERGAETRLVAGPVALATPPGVERTDVVTGLEMGDAVAALAPSADLVIMAAAVSDFRPRRRHDHKIKKAEGGLDRLELEPNPDILAGLRDVAPRALIVGFAAETRDLEGAARGKLAAKRADVLVANDVSRPEVGFDSDDNEVLVLFPDREPLTLPLQSKNLLAGRLLEIFAEELERVDAQGEPAAR